MAPPEIPDAPGELIRTKLSERGWTQTDLAKILGRPVPAISEIIAGKRGITPETAIQLGAAFGNDPREWITLESDYRLARAETDIEVIRQRTRLYAIAPVKDMERRGWIAQTATAEELERALCRFFGRESLAEEPQINVSRRSSIGGPINAAQRAWCFRARRLAEALKVSEYNEHNFAQGIKKLKRLAGWPDSASKVSDILAGMGVRFVIVEPLPKTKIDGAAFWLADRLPAVALSVRYDRIDSFWHTLGHELSHIRHHDGESLDVDIVGENRPSPAEHDPIELRADREAASTWLDPSELESFVVRVGPLYSKARINQFANRIHVHPGIIVGQLQYRGELGYQACRDTLVKVRAVVAAEALTDGWGHTVEL